MENTPKPRQLPWTSRGQGRLPKPGVLCSSDMRQGSLRDKQSLCGDNSQCLSGFPKHLFRVQSIGFFHNPLPTRQIIRNFIKEKERMR